MRAAAGSRVRSAAHEAVQMLAGQLAGEVETATRRRAEYSSDASNYRIVPEAVVFPRSVDDVLAVVEVARSTGTPLTARGGGTSIAGNAIGPGLVLDFSRYLNRVSELDIEARTATVEAGVVLDRLQQEAAPSGLRFGPDPSTHARCTLGGMIGNNACGPRAIRWGRTADNVRSVDVVDGRGRRLSLGSGFGDVPELETFTQQHLALIRTECGRFRRQVSGYSLEHLLPEYRRQLARALTGTEGTCGLVLSATVDLVPVPPARALTVLGYPDMPSAADDVPALLPLRPDALEGMDARLVDVVRRARGNTAVPNLPPGQGWLFVETSGATMAAALDAAGRICAEAGTPWFRVLSAGAEALALWRIREDGVGLAGRTPDGAPAWPGWEDAAVPPAHLGSYLRAFEELKRQHDLDGLSYGHFGDGCVHTRLDLPITGAPQRFRAFLEDAADLVVSYGGSLSGEHGDGRARSALLPKMYSAAALQMFAEFKAIFDPEYILNPGVLVDPDPVDAQLRLTGVAPLRATGSALLADRGDFGQAVHRCVGIGKCRADNTAAGGFMCPSYLATADEKDTTRGRARVLQEMVNGSLVHGWGAPEVAESLDLCLSCKACATDCPAGVDMASYKSEVLYRRYHHRPRPVSHYSLGWLPRWLAVAQHAPHLLNRLGRLNLLRRTVFRLAGIDPRRTAPPLSPLSFRRWRRRTPLPAGPAPRGEVVLWVDSFTNALDADVGRAAHQVLSAAGFRVVLPPEALCCGLTWITTGQLDTARRRLRSTVDALAPHFAKGRLIIGLEPSCTAALRSDALELLPDHPAAKQIAGATRSLAEVLLDAVDNGWQLPDLTGIKVLAQPHCHQHAAWGFGADERLLRTAGAEVRVVAGCCGLAGNFGMERGHFDVSVAVARNGFLPILENADATTVFAADGYSCRTQAEQLTGRRGVHLAELLAAALASPPPQIL